MIRTIHLDGCNSTTPSLSCSEVLDEIGKAGAIVVVKCR
jgi:hypothetical protein